MLEFYSNIEIRNVQKKKLKKLHYMLLKYYYLVWKKIRKYNLKKSAYARNHNSESAFQKRRNLNGYLRMTSNKASDHH